MVTEEELIQLKQQLTDRQTGLEETLQNQNNRLQDIFIVDHLFFII